MAWEFIPSRPSLFLLNNDFIAICRALQVAINKGKMASVDENSSFVPPLPTMSDFHQSYASR